MKLRPWLSIIFTALILSAPLAFANFCEDHLMPGALDRIGRLTLMKTLNLPTASALWTRVESADPLEITVEVRASAGDSASLRLSPFRQKLAKRGLNTLYTSESRAGTGTPDPRLIVKLIGRWNILRFLEEVEGEAETVRVSVIEQKSVLAETSAAPALLINGAQPELLEAAHALKSVIEKGGTAEFKIVTRLTNDRKQQEFDRGVLQTSLNRLGIPQTELPESEANVHITHGPTGLTESAQLSSAIRVTVAGKEAALAFSNFLANEDARLLISSVLRYRERIATLTVVQPKLQSEPIEIWSNSDFVRIRGKEYPWVTHSEPARKKIQALNGRGKRNVVAADGYFDYQDGETVFVVTDLDVIGVQG